MLASPLASADAGAREALANASLDVLLGLMKPSMTLAELRALAAQEAGWGTIGLEGGGHGHMVIRASSPVKDHRLRANLLDAPTRAKRRGMPLFIVRWAGLHASLISARDEQDLLNVLDQVDDPGGATYHLYRGPVWIDFEIPFEIRDINPDQKVATSVNDFTVEPTAEYGGMYRGEMRLEVPGCDWSCMMEENVRRVAFPHLHGWVEAESEADLAGERDEEESEHYPATLRAALVADLEPLVLYDQARAALELRDDREAQLMREMNVTVMPPAWTAPTKGSPAEPPDRAFQDAVTLLADTVARKLGVATDTVPEALKTPEARERLEDLCETWFDPLDDDPQSQQSCRLG